MTCLGFRGRRKKRGGSDDERVEESIQTAGPEFANRDPSMGPPSASFSVAQRSPGWYTLVHGRNKDRSSSTKMKKRGGQNITGEGSRHKYQSRRSSSDSSDSDDSSEEDDDYTTDSDEESLFSYRKRLPNNRRGMLDGARNHRLSTSSSERRERRRERRRRKRERRARRRSEDTMSTQSGKVAKTRGRSFMARLPSFGDKSGVWVFLTGDQLKQATKQRTKEKSPRSAERSRPRATERSQHEGDPTKPPPEFVRNTPYERGYQSAQTREGTGQPVIPPRKVAPTRSPQGSGQLPPLPKRTPGVQGTPRYKPPPGPPPSRTQPRQGKPSSPRQGKPSSPRQGKPSSPRQGKASTPKWKTPQGAPPTKFRPGGSTAPKLAPRNAQKSMT